MISGSSDKRWQDEAAPEIRNRFGDSRRGLPEIGCHGGCSNVVTRDQLVPYAFGTCSEDEALRFEAHLLDCDVCYEDLKVLDRARELVQDWTMPTQLGARRVSVDEG